MRVSIERAGERDAGEILQLLRRSTLPVEGLTEHLGTALVARHNDRIVGSAALEVYSDGALLRSVAVLEGFQDAGVGRQLTDAAIQLARDIGAPAIFLLTTTAETYFPRFGFERIERQQVPLTVQASVEFTSACPSSATVMRKSLQ